MGCNYLSLLEIPASDTQVIIWLRLYQWQPKGALSINQSINQSIDRSINQSINQTINQLPVWYIDWAQIRSVLYLQISQHLLGYLAVGEVQTADIKWFYNVAKMHQNIRYFILPQLHNWQKGNFLKKSNISYTYPKLTVPRWFPFGWIAHARFFFDISNFIK